MLSRRRAALAGAIAAGVALGVGELVTVRDESGSSLVVAVADEFVDRFAGSLKDLAVRLFGTNDKTALVAGIVAVSLALGALFGVAARRALIVGVVGFVGFGAVGAAAYVRSPSTDATVGVLAAAAAVVAGVSTLIVLLRRTVATSEGQSVASTPMLGAPRRAFLATAGVFTLGAVTTVSLSRRLRGPDPGQQFRANTTLPDPVHSRPVRAATGPDIPGLTPYITPTADFYRIDTALVVPRVDPGSWRLRLDGLVERPFSLGFDELLAMDAVAEPITMQCVSNEVGGDLVGNAVWQGVRLAELLERAGVRPGGTQVLGRSVDRFTAGFPTAILDDGRTALVAYAMNGEILPPRHGFPARLVVAGLYGYVSATKWLDTIELTSFDEIDGYWIRRGWAKEGPIKTASRIDVPRRGADLPAGGVAVAGVAWAPTRGVSGVELQVDDGPWQPCTLGDAASDQTWVQWYRRWDATPGRHVLRIRATDGTGEVQTADVSDPAPDGATGLHTRQVDVT